MAEKKKKNIYTSIKRPKNPEIDKNDQDIQKSGKILNKIS